MNKEDRPNYDAWKYHIAASINLFILGIYYTFFTAFASFFLNWMASMIFPENTNSNLIIIIELAIIAGFMSMFAFIVRETVSNLPMPLQGYGGFEKDDLRELHGSIMVAFIFLTFQKRFRKELYRLAISFGYDPRIAKGIKGIKGIKGKLR